MVKIMPPELYNVYIDNDLVGQYMPLQFALILTKAIYGEFYAEPNLKVTIEKISQDTEKPQAEVVNE